MFKPTEQPAEQPPEQLTVNPDPGKQIDEIDIPAEGRTLATGVGLKESELELLDRICDEHDVARNGLIRYGVRYFLKAYLAGEVALEFQKQYSETRRQRQLKMD